MARQPLRLRIAKAFAGTRLKELIPALTLDGGLSLGPGGGRINDYSSKVDQLTANVGWCFTANNAIVEPAAAVELKLYRRKRRGNGREEILQHQILELIDTPNLALTGEQLRQLHFTYMNFVGESYLYMRDGADSFEPGLGKLPDAIDIFPAHRVNFKLGETYTGSTVKFANKDYPATSFIRDLNPNPDNPYFGRSIIAASASVIDMERQMVEWNRRKFANGVEPSIIVNVNEPMENDVYARLQKQINDDHAGSENAGKPWIVEGEGTVTPFIVNNTDLQFLDSRKFSMTEILAMWKVSPGLLGMVENVNRSNLDTGMYQHALINTEPRVRQFVRQLNATLVKPYDPLFELDYVNPVPEDEKANLEYATAANGKMAWLMVDEVRDMYGLPPLPKGLGQNIVLPSKTATLEEVAAADVAPDQGNGTENEDEQGKGKALRPGTIVVPTARADAESSKKSADSTVSAREPIHRKTADSKPEGTVSCSCCNGVGEHYTTGYECYRSDASGYVNDAEDKQPVPCGGREDSAELWIDDQGNYRHAEEKGVGHTSLKGGGLALGRYSAETDQELLMPLTRSEIVSVKTEAERNAERSAQADAKHDLYQQNGAPYQQAMLQALHAQFELQRQAAVQYVMTNPIQTSYTGGRTKTARRKDQSKDDKKKWLALLLLWPTYNESMKEALAPILYGLITETGMQAMGQVNLEPSQFDPTTTAILTYYIARAGKIAQDVNAETEKQLRASLGQGIDAGETTDQLVARVEEVMGAAGTYRADRIATTETVRGQGFADQEAWKQAGKLGVQVTGKQWTVMSSNPCPFCLQMDGVIVELDADFLSLGDVLTADGKTLNIDYEAVPYPPVHVNCACVLWPTTVSLDE